ncbi:MAG: AgmX/PglI C-terminal domain-containing protein [Myxococcota bacterium]
MIEIPGEEAVTNPGVVVQQNVASDVKASGRRNLWTSLGAAAVVLMAATGWWLSQPEPVAAVEDNSSAGRTVLVPLSAHQDGAYTKQPEAAPDKVAEARPPVVQVKRVKRVTTPQGQPPEMAVAAADASVIPKAAGVRGMGAAPQDVFSTIGAAPKARGPQGIILSDAVKVEQMIGRVMNRGAKQLEHCYTQGLKTNPNLKGSWYVDFTIVKEGKPVAVSVEALAAPNAAIEQCIRRKVTAWRFQRITEPVDISRKYDFGM